MKGWQKKAKAGVVAGVANTAADFIFQPFGIFNSQAVDTYLAAGYKHLFQLHLENIGEKTTPPADGMMEVMWLYFDRKMRMDDAIKKPKLTRVLVQSNPQANGIYYRDLHCELINKKLEELFKRKKYRDLMPGVQCTWHGQSRSGTKSFFVPQLGDSSFSRIVPLDENDPGERERLPVMNLTERPVASTNPANPANPGDKHDKPASPAKPVNPYNLDLAKLDIIRPRHPVYFLNSSSRPQQMGLLKTGVLADTHLSTRQSLFRLVQAQIIPTIPPRADQNAQNQNAPQPNTDSPFIGPMTHEAMQSTHQLLQELGRRKDTDMVVLLGDLYDHLRNLDPRECADKIANTGDLWFFTDYRERAKKAPDKDKYYPKYLDTLLGLNAIYQFYQKHKKPLFYINGNHEGYANPYSISPRLFGDIMRLNGGIPADHNLTIYEAALLYGPSYHQWLESFFNLEAEDMQIESIRNFNIDNMELAHLLITPWQDVLLKVDDKQTFLTTGWGPGEEYILSFIVGAGTLPRASEACSSFQVELIEALGKSPGHKTMFSHFTIVNHDEDIPQFLPKGRSSAANALSEPGNAVGALPNWIPGPVQAVLSNLPANWPPEGLAADLNEFLEELLASGRFGQGMAALNNPALQEGFRGLTVNYLENALHMSAEACVSLLLMVIHDFFRILLYFFVGTSNEFNIGSFYDNDLKVYELLQNVDLTVSGHSHRAGFYVVDEIKASPLNFSYYNDGGYNPKNTKYKIPEGLSINGDDTMDNLGAPITKVTLPADKHACLVCGSSGPFARQNLFGEFASCGMAPPQGMIIDPSNNEVQIINASRNEKRGKYPARNSISSGKLKPRLAVLVDYMWHTKKLPLFDSSFVMDDLLWSVEGSETELMCYPNRDNMAALGGFLVKEIKLHAVDGDSGEYFGVAMVLKPDAGKSSTVSTPIRPIVVFDAIERFKDFKEKLITAGTTLDTAIYFVSLHFTNNLGDEWKFTRPSVPMPLAYKYLNENYDMKSPYCFPVNFEEIPTTEGQISYRIRKGGKFMSVADDEVPDFEKYESMEEYMPKLTAKLNR